MVRESTYNFSGRFEFQEKLEQYGIWFFAGLLVLFGSLIFVFFLLYQRKLEEPVVIDPEFPSITSEDYVSRHSEKIAQFLSYVLLPLVDENLETLEKEFIRKPPTYLLGENIGGLFSFGYNGDLDLQISKGNTIESKKLTFDGQYVEDKDNITEKYNLSVATRENNKNTFSIDYQTVKLPSVTYSLANNFQSENSDESIEYLSFLSNSNTWIQYQNRNFDFLPKSKEFLDGDIYADLSHVSYEGIIMELFASQSFVRSFKLLEDREVEDLTLLCFEKDFSREDIEKIFAEKGLVTVSSINFVVCLDRDKGHIISLDSEYGLENQGAAINGDFSIQIFDRNEKIFIDTPDTFRYFGELYREVYPEEAIIQENARNIARRSIVDTLSNKIEDYSLQTLGDIPEKILFNQEKFEIELYKLAADQDPFLELDIEKFQEVTFLPFVRVKKDSMCTSNSKEETGYIVPERGVDSLWICIRILGEKGDYEGIVASRLESDKDGYVSPIF